MRIQVPKISSLSEYYVYAPSILAQKIYLYPLSVGHYIYEPGYEISRNNFDSFLIMFIIKGFCSVWTNGQAYAAKSGDVVLLDCYMPHSYGSHSAWETIWLHFDGPVARAYYQEIGSHYGHVLTLPNDQNVRGLLEKIYNSYRNAAPIVESALSGDITSILNELLIPKADIRKKSIYPMDISDIVAYINEHFREQISLGDLAAKANLSLYYFTRVFSWETGYTPHQYLINTRITAAKYMLKSSESSIKNIAFSTGFNSESNFCTTFKKWENLTPSEYRESIHNKR